MSLFDAIAYEEAVEEFLGGPVPSKPGSADLAGVTDGEWIARQLRERAEVMRDGKSLYETKLEEITALTRSVQKAREGVGLLARSTSREAQFDVMASILDRVVETLTDLGRKA